MKRLLQSLRWRLQAWHALILFLVIAAFLGMAHRVAREAILRRNDRTMSETERMLMGTVFQTVFGRGPGANPMSMPAASEIMERLRVAGGEVPAALAATFGGTEPGYLYFAILSDQGRVLLQSDNAPGGLEPLPVPKHGEFVEDFRFVDGLRRELRRTLPSVNFTVVVGRDIQPELDLVGRLGGTLIAIGTGVWLLGLVGGWWIAGRAIAPIATISGTATRIAAGNLAERIDTRGAASELNQLSQVLNQTFDRLQAAFEQQKQFTADASHELRTPVTILLSETQRVLRRERSPEEYRQVIATCQAAAERMRHLTEALLTLAREEAAGARPAPQRCDLALIAGDTLAQLGPLAAERSIRLIRDLSPAPCLGDPGSLAILTSNLIRNALQHHHAGGSVHVTTASDGSHATLTVSDDGPGIPAEDLPHIFQRFYRADKARTSGSAHAGLGLAIAKTIADNHGGTIEVDSTPGAGARFVLKVAQAAG